VTAQDALRKLLAEEDAGDCAGAGGVNDEQCVARTDTDVPRTRRKSWREMVSIAMAWVVDMNCDYFGSLPKPYGGIHIYEVMNSNDGAWILFKGKVYLLSNLKN